MMHTYTCDGLAGMVTTKRAAKLLGVCQDTVLMRIAHGKLPATRLGDKLWLIRLSDLSLDSEPQYREGAA